MSKKRTLADLMDNDFFIDFEDTKAKVARKRLNESVIRKRTLTESINESEVESCYKRVCASAAENQVINDPDDVALAIKVSKEHLKKALKLGAFSLYADNEPRTVPAQYVDSVDIEFLNNIMIDEDYCQLAVQLHGEYEGEDLNDYVDGVCFVQFREYPAFDTEGEALEFFETEIRPNITKIAEEMIDEAWAASGCTDYEGITDISGEDEEDEEPVNIEDGGKEIKADFSNWKTLIETADVYLGGLVHSSGNDDYDDGDGYWITEYTVWCNRYLYHTDALNNEAKLKTLCDEYSKKLPGVLFYYNIDAEEGLCEIGYEASKKVEESKLKEGLYDYELIEGKDKISEEDLYKALVTDGELVAINAGNIDAGKGISFRDGGVYCDTTYEINEYDGKFSVTAFYTSDDGDWKEGDSDEFDSFDSLCAFIQENFPGLLIESKIKEEVEEPDNAVVACKINKVIAHCEDEKPVDCLGKKKPLDKPLAEDFDSTKAAAQCSKKCYDFYKAIADKAPDKELKKHGRVAYKFVKDQFGLTGQAAEDLLTKGYVVWKQLNGRSKVEAITADAKKMTAAELKAKHGTDDVDLINAGKEPKERVELKEARTPDEIRAEIAKLQQELAAAQAAEKKASYGNNLPTEVWIWDVYLEPNDKGTWTSAELYNGKYDGYVFETEDEALDAAWSHLSELEDEGELEGDPDDYYVEAFSVLVSEVDEDTLSESGLNHLVESLKESRSDVDTVRIMAWCAHNCVDFFKSVATNGPKTKQRKLNKEAYKAMQAKFGLDTAEAEELMGKGYALWKSLYWRGTNESLKEAVTTEMYIIAADGEAGGSLYYIGTDYKTAQKEFRSTARDWRRYGLGGGDTPVYLYQYFGPARLFNKICSKYNAGEQLDYSINIEELGFDLSDCKILDEEWGD